MAYVLGVIFTDGNIIPGRERDSNYKGPGSRLSIAQKEPELLEKVLALMECDAKIYRGKQVLTGNPIHTFNIASEELFDDLLALGLTPKKSRTIKFPNIPQPYVRDFIRGCWDGDGSVYLERDQFPRASYVTGSRQFAEELIRHLVLLGLPSVTLHTQKTRNSFYFRFGTVADCTKLYHVLYDDVPESMYLRRKYERFKKYALGWEGERVHKGESHFAIPEPFTRTTLSRLLKISATQVGRILESSEIAAGIQRLAQFKANSSKEFTDGVRELRSKVKLLLCGWADEGWDDLD